MSSFKSGDRVSWRYKHSLGRSYTYRTKTGEYIGQARYRPGGKYGPLVTSATVALVWFDGNRQWSKVPLKDLRAGDVR